MASNTIGDPYPKPIIDYPTVFVRDNLFVPCGQQNLVMGTTDSGWIETYTGKKLHLNSPNPDDISIEDIAHALSMTCRWGGHCKKFYSVAEHSVHIAHHILNPRDALFGLLHDAHEAYIGDMPKPFKATFPTWKHIEDILDDAIFTHFGLQGFSMPSVVKELDIAILTNEKKALMGDVDWGYEPAPPIRELKLKCWEPKEAERHFMETFKGLSASCKDLV